MRKTVLTILGAVLIAGSAAQLATASARQYRAPVAASQQFRNANNAVAWPAQPNWVSDYSEGHVISAPAGR